ncbi:MAG TPA: D-aminoacyl-tRNA deacylase [Verrucomicrobiae bacterium]|nr:D-aminoacyl-tRNA deacylase [Verrucomicrobiae bacterium]
MRIVLQRVSSASVVVEGKTVGAIERGLLLLVGVHINSTGEQAATLAQKCAELRIFADEAGKMNLSAKDLNLGALVISQFTLYGETRKGRRPNFMDAARPEQAIPLYELFVAELRKHLPKVETGIFGAMMDVHLVNDGPVTLILEG